MSSSTCVVVSYFPLLAGKPGESLDFEEGSLEALTGLLKELPDGNADCCLWVLKDGESRPVLVMKDADLICDHLLVWSEGDPVGWFSLTLMQKDGKYLIGLAPDVGRSIERFKMARQLRTGFPVPKDTKFKVMFRCLYFVSGPSNMFDLVKDQLSEEVSVGIMDRSLLDVQDPGSMDPDKIRWIGPFQQTREGWMGEYFNAILDEAVEPKEGSVAFQDGKLSIP